jgi:peptide chain release factor 2
MSPQDIKNIEIIGNSITLIKNFINYESTKNKLNDLQGQIQNPNFWDDHEAAVVIMKEKDKLQNLLSPADYLEGELSNLKELIELSEIENNSELLNEISETLEKLSKESVTLQIEAILSEEHDDANCFVEVNSGAGGTEAQDWAEMLARMYFRWAEKRGYKIEITDKNDGEEAGVKSITMNIKGNKAYGWLKKESGVHRLVRISPFDSNARRHTSFASVLVSPELDKSVEIDINDADLRIDTYRASGAGGQHVNKTDSAVRITHIPTGIISQSQVDRSQHRNKEIAMNMLKAKIYAKKLKEQEEAANASQNKTDIAWGNQIRSYVLQPYQMVKDNRTGMEKGNAYGVLDGDMDDFLESSISSLYDIRPYVS